MNKEKLLINMLQFVSHVYVIIAVWKKCENRLYCFELADELRIIGQKCLWTKGHSKIKTFKSQKQSLYNFAFLFKLTYK